MTTEPVGLIYDRHDGLMTGLAELRVCCVYRLEELVRTEQTLLPDQLQTSTHDGDQWEEELILNQRPEAASPPERFLRHHLDGPLRLAETCSGETIGRLQPWSSTSKRCFL